MRPTNTATLLVALLLVNACAKPAPVPVVAGLKPGLYMAADGRGRLCVRPDGKSTAIIAFVARSPVNCSAAGRIVGTADAANLVPTGEGACRLPLQIAGARVTVGSASVACDYYCGPGARWGGQTYRWGGTSTANTLAEPSMPSAEC